MMDNSQEQDHKPAVEATALPAAAEPSRRLSFGMINVGKLRGLWEANATNSNKLTGAMIAKGSSTRVRGKFNPMAQSQDRGLLFKLTDAKLEADDEAEGQQQQDGHLAAPQQVTSPTAAKSGSPDLGQARTTSKSALKKMWKSMTSSTVKSMQLPSRTSPGDATACDSPKLVYSLNSLVIHEDQDAARECDLQPKVDQCSIGALLALTDSPVHSSAGMDQAAAYSASQWLAQAADYISEHQATTENSPELGDAFVAQHALVAHSVHEEAPQIAGHSDTDTDTDLTPASYVNVEPEQAVARDEDVLVPNTFTTEETETVQNNANQSRSQELPAEKQKVLEAEVGLTGEDSGMFSCDEEQASMQYTEDTAANVQQINAVGEEVKEANMADPRMSTRSSRWSEQLEDCVSSSARAQDEPELPPSSIQKPCDMPPLIKCANSPELAACGLDVASAKTPHSVQPCVLKMSEAIDAQFDANIDERCVGHEHPAVIVSLDRGITDTAPAAVHSSNAAELAAMEFVAAEDDSDATAQETGDGSGSAMDDNSNGATIPIGRSDNDVLESNVDVSTAPAAAAAAAAVYEPRIVEEQVDHESGRLVAKPAGGADARHTQSSFASMDRDSPKGTNSTDHFDHHSIVEQTSSAPSPSPHVAVEQPTMPCTSSDAQDELSCVSTGAEVLLLTAVGAVVSDAVASNVTVATDLDPTHVQQVPAACANESVLESSEITETCMDMDMEPPCTPLGAQSALAGAEMHANNSNTQAMVPGSTKVINGLEKTQPTTELKFPGLPQATESPTLAPARAMDASPAFQQNPVACLCLAIPQNTEPTLAGSLNSAQTDNTVPAATASISPRLPTQTTARQPTILPAVSIGTDALVSDLMAALQDVDDAALQHIRDAANADTKLVSQAVVSTEDQRKINEHASSYGFTLELIDMDMEDATMASPAKGIVGIGMPALDAVPLPVVCIADPSSCKPNIQVMRESIPLFVRDSYAVSDSVSLDRQSLASVEPFGKPTTTGGHIATHVSNRPSELMASMLTLDTLQEDECFNSDLLRTPPAVGVASNLTKIASIGKGGRVGGRTGQGSLTLGKCVEAPELPNDLPDPDALRGIATSAGAHAMLPQTGVVSAAPGSTHKAAPAAASPVAGKNITPDVSSIPLQKATGTKTPPSGIRRLSGPLSASPVSSGSKQASANNARTPASHTRPTTGTASSSASKAAPTGLNTPGSARLRTGGVYSSNRATTHSATAEKVATSAPAQTAMVSSPAAIAQKPAAIAQILPSVAASKPASSSPTEMVSSPLASTGVSAVAPPMPTSWATPLAQMQQLPFDFAVHAPLLDNSPFPDLDNMDTLNIAEEANRMAQALGGRKTTPTPNFKAHGTTPQLKPSAYGQPTPTLRPSSTPSGVDTPTLSADGYTLNAISGVSGLANNGLSPAASGFLEAQNAMLLERLLAAEQRAQAAEASVEQLKDQIQTMTFGDDMMQAGASDMEREARLCAEEQLHTVKAQIAVLQDTVRTLQSSLNDKQAALEKVEASNAQLISQLASTTNELQLLQQTAAVSVAQVSQLQAQQIADHQALAATRAELAALQSSASEEISALQHRLEESQRDVAKSQSALKRSADELIAAQLHSKQHAVEAGKQAAALQASLARYKADRDALRKQVEELQAAAVAAQERHNQEVLKLKHERDQLIHMADELMGSLEQERNKARQAGAA